MSRNEWLTYFERELEPHIVSMSYPNKRTFLIARKVVEIRFSSEELSLLLSNALAHREVDSSEVDPSEGTHSEILDSSAPDLKVYVVLRSEIPQRAPAAISCAMQKDISWRFHGDSSIIELYSANKSCAYCIIDDATSIKYWTLASPFRRIFDWFFSRHGVEMIHGAAIGIGEKAVLITGPGGSGKSTTAMQCYLAGLNYFSDDHVAVSGDGVVHGMYRTLKVLHNNPFFSTALGRVLPCNADKKVFVLDSPSVDTLPQSASIEAVLVPRFTESLETRINKADVTHRAPELSPFALKQSRWITSAQGSILRGLMNSLPCYFLELGSEIARVPSIIRDFCSNTDVHVID